MSKLIIETASVFTPLLEPSRYKGAHGGRGSGKSHFFGELGAEDALRYPGDFGEGLRMVCIREVQKSLKESAKRLIEDKLRKFGLGESDGFKVFKDVIETPGDGLIMFQGMKDHTADSIKSLEGFHRAWVEEAQTFSSKSLELLRPTMRAANSEIWFSWNPSRPTDPVDQMLRGPNTPSGCTVVRANWSDNPWFPKELLQERQDSEANDPDRYGHIWEGEYARVYEGAYFASHIEVALREGRVGFVARDPLIQVKAYWDIGGTSDRADATAIWVCQRVGQELRILDHYEAVGQEFKEHVHWLRSNGYQDALMKLPHDGRRHDTVYAVTPQSYLNDAGFSVATMQNEGKGAAMQRVEAVRRAFPNIRFNESTTGSGREALAWYHEKRRDDGYGLGPEHDWSSHSADAFGAMCIDYLSDNSQNTWGKPIRRNVKGIA